ELRLERINVTLSPGREALAVSGDAIVEPGGVRLKISDGALVPVPGRPLGDAALRGALEVVAPDLTALGARVLASPRLAGAAEGTLRLSGTMARPIAAGDVRLRRLTLAAAREGCVPATRQLVVEQIRAPVALTLVGMESARLEARAGGGTVSAQVRLAFAPGSPVILKDLSVKGVELRPILVDYLCQGFAVTGPLDLSGETAMLAADPWRSMAGAGRFRIGSGKVVGAEILEVLNQAARLGGAIPSVLREGRLWSAGAPPDFKSISGTYRVDRGVLRSDDIVYESPAARITAAGAYALGDGRVDVVAIVASGPTEVRVRVAGRPGAIRLVPIGIRAGEPGGVRKLLDRVLR
ncbi:MAG TPA: AsmA-like C-terminal region-containing protein, partial [Candidatus Limnocylindrales bacterium]|nr:AsmA-like C-terminal region-containing protein [Candidatus Limnocylindrales bacterium]